MSSPVSNCILSKSQVKANIEGLGTQKITTTTTTSLFQIKYSLQSLCPQLAKAIRGRYKRKKKIV